jgi:hypothetical protein
VRHVKFAARRVVGQQRADIAVAAGVEDPVPGFDRLRRVETLRRGIRNPLEDLQAVVFIAPYFPLLRLYDGGLSVSPECM